jgi:hypothetical protein
MNIKTVRAPKVIGIFMRLLLLVSVTSCRSTFNPNKKYGRTALQKDYVLLRNILQNAHPSLYWYTPPDSMNYYLDEGLAAIEDSMTEPQFKNVLSYTVGKINCGHTTIKYSKAYTRYLDTVQSPVFPLLIKFLQDSAIVNFNLNRKDIAIKKGTLLHAINGLPMATIRDSLFQYLSTDGYSINHKYQQLSNTGGFGNLYKAVFGLTSPMQLLYTDSAGTQKIYPLQTFDARTDTAFLQFNQSTKKTYLSKKQQKLQRRLNARNLQIDTSLHSAYLTVNTFASGNKLKPFFKQSFKAMQQHGIKHLVIDLRFNGGGNVANSTLLTQYITDRSFKLADSLFAIKRLSTYEKYIQNSFFAAFLMYAMTAKHTEGYYHFGYFERHFFKPKKKNHFNGHVYLITGGNTFSAATLFTATLKDQPHVKIIGEETGGGAYGNNAWFIPDITLPNTRLRCRLPRFRLVVNKNSSKDGRGVLPDVLVKPTQQSIAKGVDTKMEYVKQLILAYTVQ